MAGRLGSNCKGFWAGIETNGHAQNENNACSCGGPLNGFGKRRLKHIQSLERQKRAAISGDGPNTSGRT